MLQNHDVRNDRIRLFCSLLLRPQIKQRADMERLQKDKLLSIHLVDAAASVKAASADSPPVGRPVSAQIPEIDLVSDRERISFWYMLHFRSL